MLLFAFVLPILLTLYQRGKPLRDAELLADLARIEQASNGETFLGLHPDEHPSWLIRAYAFRLYRITLDADLYKYQQCVGRKPFDQKNDIDLTPENQEWKLYETPHLTHPDQLTAADRLLKSGSPNAEYR